jgi:hypothetical protein
MTLSKKELGMLIKQARREKSKRIGGKFTQKDLANAGIFIFCFSKCLFVFGLFWIHFVGNFMGNLFHELLNRWQTGGRQIFTYLVLPFIMFWYILILKKGVDANDGEREMGTESKEIRTKHGGNLHHSRPRL